MLLLILVLGSRENAEVDHFQSDGLDCRQHCCCCSVITAGSYYTEKRPVLELCDGIWASCVLLSYGCRRSCVLCGGVLLVLDCIS